MLVQQVRCAAHELRPLLVALLGEDLPLRLRAWDGSESGPDDADLTLVLRSPRALRQVLWSPDELGLGRAYVSGELDLEGDLYAFLSLPEQLSRLDRPDLTLGWRDRASAVRTGLRLGALGLPPAPPPEEVRLRGARHALRRDAQAVTHLYDVGNDFYRLVLGPTMAYSCAYWARPSYGLDEAQHAKHDLVARKLGLRAGMRLLDVGCGWGGMALHAARLGVRVLGITISPAQAELARQRAADAGVADLVEIRLQDYREVADGPYDAVCSIGIAEHVGLEQLSGYARRLHALLRPGGRLLHHAISRRPGSMGTGGDRSFLARYVFPDGELQTMGTTVSVLEDAGLEVRDVEALREHYALTCRAWAARLDKHWGEAVAASTPGRARVWKLYLAAAALAFEDQRTGVNQVLAVRPDGTRSGMPLARADWVC